MLTNRDRYRAARAKAETALKGGVAPCGLGACPDCGTVLQETITGIRRYVDRTDPKNPVEKRVCSDCYFDALDGLITEHPLKSTPVLR